MRNIGAYVGLTSRHHVPAGDDGDGKFDRFFASVRKADRDFNIEPLASP